MFSGVCVGYLKLLMCDAMLTDALSFKFVFLRLWKRKVIQLNDNQLEKLEAAKAA